MRNPYSLRGWLRYIDHKRTGTLQELTFIYERALRELPGSYKLWKHYLDLRREKLTGLSPVKYSSQYTAVNNAYERALILLNKVRYV